MSGNPILDSLIPSDQALQANWQNNPYVGINNASLLVVNKLTNKMNYIYLTEEEALVENYIINGLTNGETYYVRYTQVQVTPDGTPYSSNTLSAVPCSVPDAPVLNSVVVTNVQAGTADASVTFGSSNGSLLESIVFQLLDETNGVISSQTFQFTNPTPVDGEIRTFTLASLTSDSTYVVSCQVINNAGYSNLSNSLEFEQSYAPAAVNVLNVVSGFDSYLNVTVQGVFNTFAVISRIYVEVTPSPITNSSVWDSLGYLPVGTWPVNGIFTFNTNTLTNPPLEPVLINGIAVNVRAYAFNGQDGMTGNENLTGVPDLAPVLSNAELEIEVDNPSNGSLTASWESNDPTFLPQLVRAEFFDASQNSLGVVVTSSSPALLSGLTLVYGDYYSVSIVSTCTVPPSVAQYWLEPALLPGNKIISNVVTATTMASTVPGQIPYSSIQYITGQASGAGVIQFFWQEPVNTGYSPITNYTASLYDVYPSTSNAVPVATISTGLVENCLFTDLILNTQQYWVVLVASNANGAGPATTYPLDQSGIFIVGSIAPVSDLSAVQIQQTQTNIVVELSWTAATQSGYTLTSFDVYSISSSGVQTKLGSVNYVAGTQDYSFNALVSIQPSSYLFGVISNAVTTPGNVPVSSVMQTVSFSSSGIPIISGITFGVQNNGNGIANFYITKNGSNIILSGILLFVAPLTAAEGVNPVVNAAFNTGTIPAINAAEDAPFLITWPLNYPIASQPPCLIECSNQVASAYVALNLS
jgi:hypothetical protein